METTNRLDVGLAIKGSFQIGLKNVLTILGASVLWLITVWIPYLNIGTTIAYFTVLPTKLAKGEPFSPGEIFDAKYRENMTGFFLILGLINTAIGFGFLLFFFPGLVLYYAWLLAPVMVINFGVKPIDALSESYKATYGSKWALFFSYLLLGFILFFIGLIVSLITAGFAAIATWLGALVGFILTVVFIVVSLALLVGLFAQIIKSLLIKEEAEAPVV
ncbi:MAG: hypothetical protein RG741_04120 [Bacteroidales bacterium]|nr:hypothetical protein [Bacteroidales bacterium]